MISFFLLLYTNLSSEYNSDVHKSVLLLASTSNLAIVMVGNLINEAIDLRFFLIPIMDTLNQLMPFNENDLTFTELLRTFAEAEECFLIPYAT